MTKFSGFPNGDYSILHIPPMFFGELLPQIDDLAELKVILFCLWALPQKTEKPAYLTWDEFASHPPLLDGLCILMPHLSPTEALQTALDKTVMRGVLLKITIALPQQAQTLYFLNTEKGREAVRRIQQGEWQPVGERIQFLPEKPNIYKLYLENVGAITPMIADELKDAERDFDLAWIEEAISIAVKMNKRNIKYIRGILERWRREGKHDGKTKEHEEDSRRYLYDEFGNPLK